jgi:peptidoglycan/xylan/chitin deacetylase (PgdA/CDA1 family)
MKINSIMYHDIVAADDWESSGFAGSGADVYKLDRDVFAEHLQLLHSENVTPRTVFDVENNAKNVLITFDDGGESAYTHAADLLETFGWRGHFFIATDFIDTPTFLKKNQIRELHERGHIIGSHSASHPTRMSNCTKEEMLFEWKSSCEKLSVIIGNEIKVASVPGGYFSKEVAETASECGIEILFNSEPVAESYKVENCEVYGRFTIQQTTALKEFSGLAIGTGFYQIKQFALWNSKKLAKKLGGKAYLNIRKKILEK